MKINTHGDITYPIIEGDFVAVGGLRRLREELRQLLDRKNAPVTGDGIGDGAGDRRVFILDHES
jgi:hypothetical protein